MYDSADKPYKAHRLFYDIYRGRITLLSAVVFALRNVSGQRCIIYFLALLSPTTLYAQGSGVTAQTMIENIAAQVPNLMQMVTAIAYVMGMYFIIMGVVKLKHFGEMRTQMSQEHSLKGPLIFLAVGALLLYLPTSVNVGMSTFWTTPNPYGYLQQQSQWAEFINDSLLIVQLVGVIAFIRGLVTMSHLGGHGGQPGTFAKGLTFIIAGIFCINVWQFLQVIFATLGIPMPVM